MKKVCPKCDVAKDASEYSVRNAETGRLHYLCKTCHSNYRHAHYLKNKRKYLDKAKRWSKQHTSVLRKYILGYLSKNHCVDCGISDVRVLDFDHEHSKYMGVAQMVRNCYSMEAIKKEIAKCRIRCANCHRIKTFSKGNFWKNRMGP